MTLPKYTRKIQQAIGAKVDGIYGKETAKGVLAKLGITMPEAAIQIPPDNNDALIAYYGEPGSNQVRLPTPYPLRLAWDLDTSIRSFYCHKIVKNDLEEIFISTLEHYGLDQIRHLGLDKFGGCLNVRKKRGGSSWSVHAFGAAVDLDPDNNRLRWDSSRAKFAKPEYEPFWGFVESAGAISLGREKNFDWMHFQFAQ